MSWDNLHNHYSQQDWSKIPSIFATEVIEFFPKSGRLLELGAGLGQDSRYFHSLGYVVDSTDFSSYAVEMNEKQYTGEGYRTFILDIISDLNNISDEQYDVIYAHLSLHYFSLEMTYEILKNIFRILRHGGIIVTLLNTTSDPEYGTGIQIEQNFFMMLGQNQKRYFSLESTEDIFGKYFQTLLCDNQGETYKDSAKGIHNLIRYIGQK